MWLSAIGADWHYVGAIAGFTSDVETTISGIVRISLSIQLLSLSAVVLLR
jgi:hypothetical protein